MGAEYLQESNPARAGAFDGVKRTAWREGMVEESAKIMLI
jgi:hypothetical protein